MRHRWLACAGIVWFRIQAIVLSAPDVELDTMLWNDAAKKIPVLNTLSKMARVVLCCYSVDDVPLRLAPLADQRRPGARLGLVGPLGHSFDGALL